ncbi:hypothetical protein ElyMa_001849900 [Elysia marginata]|uniref:Uncharacterized protein n=1 Tax=Elysia marginata TaxID=1093978 RepID=A0AAV4EKG1_9GAST|nr:hypothetical protein ElyMa_001849900 [Elysia marginata]
MLQCSEKLSDNKHEVNSSSSESSNYISSLTIYKLNRSNGGPGTSQWAQMASITNQLQASEIRLGDRIDRLGNLLEDKLTSQGNGSCNQLQAVGSSSWSHGNDTGNTKLENLSTGISVVISLTEGLVSEFGGLGSGLSVDTNLTEGLVSDFGGFNLSFANDVYAPVDDFFDPLGTGRKVWRLAFRGTAYNNVPVYPAFMYGTGILPEVEAGCKQFDRNLACINHYRNKDALEN